MSSAFSMYMVRLFLFLGLSALVAQAAPMPQSSTASSSSFWLANIQRQGTVAFGNSSSYQIFRNVKDFGAKGDGSTDDTDAINQAISSGNRCGLGCDSSTVTPALVYFPPGTYVVSKPLIQYYYTQFVGDAVTLPVLKASASFAGMAVIDSDPYEDNGANWYTNQNNFSRSVRNFVIDLTAMPQSAGAGIHWQVAQASSLQNIRFEMVKGGGDANKQQGVFMDNGSGGFMTDLTFNGGNYGMFLGNQQFTTRNLTFNGCNTAIFMNWNWAWTLKSVSVSNCAVALNMSNTPSNQTVGSVMFLDSTLSTTKQAIVTAFTQDSIPNGGGALVLDNVDFTGSSVAVAGVGGNTILAGGAVVESWVQGNTYVPGSTKSKRFVQSLDARAEADSCPAPQIVTFTVTKTVPAGTPSESAAPAVAINSPSTGIPTAVSSATSPASGASEGSGASGSQPSAGSAGSSGSGASASSATDANGGVPIVASSAVAGSDSSVVSAATSVASATASAGSISFSTIPVFVGTSSAIPASSSAPGSSRAAGTASAGTCANTAASKVRTQSALTAATKPKVLVDGQGKVFERSKPQYENLAASSFVSVKSAGAKGDGTTDDTAAIQKVLDSATADQVVYFDHGAYIITTTIKVPKNIKITGEVWPLLMASGTAFADEKNPIPMLQIGQPGDTGSVELSDLILETKGPAPGAILMEWNVAEASQGSVGMWDVHFRVGGSAGTELQSDKCSKNPTSTAAPNAECMGAFMLLHITAKASAYVENSWFWVADHELDLGDHNQIDIYNGRGVLIESNGPVWLYGTSSEHSQLYNYQIANAKNVYMAMIQSETPYYQANPNALTPFTPQSSWSDPDFSTCTTDSCKKAWGLRVVTSSDLYVYGAGLYSFFDNYSQTCLSTESCQENMVQVDCSDVHLYGLSTKASTNMVTSSSGKALVLQGDNTSNYCSTVALFQQTSS